MDGDVETLWLAAERVRLALAPGETLPPPAPSALRKLACHLLAAARTADTGWHGFCHQSAVGVMSTAVSAGDDRILCKDISPTAG